MSQALIDQIDAVIASGVGSVSYMGRTVTYQSLDELLRIRAILTSRQSGGRRTFIRTKFRSDSGC